MGTQTNSLDALREAVLRGEAATAEAEARAALSMGFAPLALVNDAVSPALAEAGRLFEQGDYFVPELLVAAGATKAVFDLLRPLLAKSGIEPAGRVAIGTVRGDVHDIGKNLVAAMLEGAGFELLDLGVDVPPERFVAAAREAGTDVVGLSALLSTTLPAMAATVRAMTEAGVRPRVKIVVGGAPVTARFAAEIGADAYAESAAAAGDVVRGLVGLGPTGGRPREERS
jgi:5-methyltetrahydrofolate--homocysteine methyltransferase